MSDSVRRGRCSTGAPSKTDLTYAAGRPLSPPLRRPGLLLLTGIGVDATAATLAEINDFGSNPGGLRTFAYIPDGLSPSSPLMVVLHGCRQRATDYDDETGWTELASDHLVNRLGAVDMLR